jgi:hypothetical protein
VAQANAAGGKDNITVVVARFLDAAQPVRTEQAQAGATMEKNGKGTRKEPAEELAVVSG